MAENPVLMIFDDYQDEIDQERCMRDDIRSINEELDQTAREVSGVLHIIHHTNEKEIKKACNTARDLLGAAREGYAKMKVTVPETEYFKYHDHFRYVTTRFTYLIGLIVWLETGTLASLADVAETLGISDEEKKVGFHLDIEDYLTGVLQICSELSRLAVNTVTLGNYENPLKIYRFVMEINAGFRLLSLKNAPLRKRFDALKYDVKKIEEVIFDLGMRGFLPQATTAQTLKGVIPAVQAPNPGLTMECQDQTPKT